MPAFIIQNGRRIFKPGVYGQLTFNGVNPPTGLNQGNLALCGAFPSFEPCTAPDKPVTFTNAKDMAAWDPTDAALQQLADICFAPWAGGDFGGAASVTICNAQTCTQAYKQLVDSASAGALTLAAIQWGTKGNRVYYSLKSATTDPGLTITLAAPGKTTEVYSTAQTQSGVLAEIQSTSSDLAAGNDTSLLTVDPTQFLWKWSKRLASMANAAEPSQNLANLSGTYPARTSANTGLTFEPANVLELQFGTAAPPTNPLSVTVVGVDDTGAARTVVDSITVISNTAWYPIESGGDRVFWSTVSSITVTTTVGSADNTYAPVMVAKAANRKSTNLLTQLVIDSVLELQFSTTPTEDVRVTVTGTDSLGVTRTVADTITVASTAVWYTVEDEGGPVTWQDITEVVVETTSVADVLYAPTIDMRGTAYDLVPGDYDKLTDMLTVVNNGASKGFVATIKSPKAYDAPANQIDKQTAVSVKSTAKASLRADLWAIVQALSASLIVEVTRDTSADLPPYPWKVGSDTTVSGTLAGGTIGAFTVPTDLTAALAEITTLDIQFVAAWGTTSAAAGQALDAHCTAAALVGSERCAFFAAPTNTSLAVIESDYAFVVNSRNVAVHAQEIQLTSVMNGAATWFNTQYQAIQRAAEQAALPVGRSPVNKTPKVLNFRGHWDAPADDNEVIQAHCSAYTRKTGTNQIVVLSDVTTYSVNNDEVRSQVSSNASCNQSIRQVRGALDAFVGQDNAVLSVDIVKQQTEAELDRQVLANEIKNYRNVNVVESGTVWNVEYDCAPAEPALFFRVTGNVTRF
jgi:hypothetical protein